VGALIGDRLSWVPFLAGVGAGELLGGGGQVVSKKGKKQDEKLIRTRS
jgi:hypothetical protein